MDIKNNGKTVDLKKRLFLMVLLAVYPICILQSCVLSPIYTITDSNVSYDILPIVLKYLGIVIDIFNIFFSLSIVIYGLIRYSLSEIRSTFIMVIAAPLLKNLLKLLLSPIVDGKPSVEFFLMDMYSLGLSAVLEIIQLLVIIYVVYKFVIAKYKEKVARINKAADRLGKDKIPSTAILPFEGMLDIKNPLQFGALISSIIVVAVRVIMLVIHDINMKWFPADINNALIFFGGYIIEIVVGLLGYFLMIYVFISIGANDSAAFDKK